MNPIHADGLRVVEHGEVVHVIFTDSLAEHSGQGVTNVVISKTSLREAMAKLGIGYVGSEADDEG